MNDEQMKDLADEIALDEAVGKIKEKIVMISNFVQSGQTKRADKLLKEIENIITDYACGDPFDLLGGDLQKAKADVGQKRKESRLKNKQ